MVGYLDISKWKADIWVRLPLPRRFPHLMGTSTSKMAYYCFSFLVLLAWWLDMLQFVWPIPLGSCGGFKRGEKGKGKKKSWKAKLWLGSRTSRREKKNVYRKTEEENEYWRFAISRKYLFFCKHSSGLMLYGVTVSTVFLWYFEYCKND